MLTDRSFHTARFCKRRTTFTETKGPDLTGICRLLDVHFAPARRISPRATVTLGAAQYGTFDADVKATGSSRETLRRLRAKNSSAA